jgi:hypothetical protein
MKIKSEQLTKMHFIKKYFEQEIVVNDNEWNIVLIDGEMITELDDENSLIYADASTISYEGVEKYNVYVNRVSEIEIPTNYKDFYKIVDKAIKFQNKNMYGSGFTFSDYSSDGWIGEELLVGMQDLEVLMGYFNRGIKLFEMNTIVSCVNI